MGAILRVPAAAAKRLWWERGGTKKWNGVFAAGRKRSEMDFGPTTGPPMAQEKAIAEAKAMQAE